MGGPEGTYEIPDDLSERRPDGKLCARVVLAALSSLPVNAAYLSALGAHVDLSSTDPEGYALAGCRRQCRFSCEVSVVENEVLIVTHPSTIDCAQME